MPATKSIKHVRPDKPRKDFPRFAHASGQWAKKVRGKIFYFRVWADPDAARRRYEHDRVDLEAGRKPRPRQLSEGGVDVAAICNAFLEAKKAMVEAGELSPRS